MATQDESAAKVTPVGRLSFAERKQKGNATPERNAKGKGVMGIAEAPPSGRVAAAREHEKPGKSVVKKRSAVSFFEDAFSVGDNSAAKERIRGDAIVMAEVKTNVIISDEFTFITELSYHLSTRYQRPVSSIVVTLHHGACLFFGGSFDAAYVMSIFALPSQLLPTTNKRNAALIQKHMEDTLGVVPARGLLRFVPTKEEHMAYNGKTTAGEIDELEKRVSSHAHPVPGGDDENTVAASKQPVGRRRLSVKSLKSARSRVGMNAPASELTPPASADETLPTIPASPPLPTVVKGRDEAALPQGDMKKPRKKKSFVSNIFTRSTSKVNYTPGLATVPGEKG